MDNNEMTVDLELRHILGQINASEPGSEEQERLVKAYKALSDAATEAFRAESDDVNNNNRNRVEMRKAILDNIRYVILGGLSAGVTMYLGKGCFDTEEVGAVTSKVWGLLGKKF